MATAKTLYDKLFDAHLVHEADDGTCRLYIDRHLVHEVTSPQAFEGLRLATRQPWRLDANLATPDHNVPTTVKERCASRSSPASGTAAARRRDSCCCCAMEANRVLTALRSPSGL